MTRTDTRDLLWLKVGAAVLLAVTLAAFHFRRDRTTADRIALQAKRVDTVTAIRLAVVAASEAEKSAVLALSDEDSLAYAERARASTAEAERARSELALLLNASGSAKEKDLLTEFSSAFAELRRVDEAVLGLAVRNSNVKAYGLAFGPAAKAIEEMDGALSRLETKSANGTVARDVLPLAFRAQSGALRIQALLAPHIAEESDEKMDAREAAMTEQDREVRGDLEGLAAIQGMRDDPDLAAASSSYARFGETKTQILGLSRENTNVRAVAVSLSEKRKVTLLCQSILDALQEAIETEPPVRAEYGRFGRPAKLP